MSEEILNEQSEELEEGTTEKEFQRNRRRYR